MSFWIRVVVEPDGDTFVAYAPGLQGCTTWGRTPDEAKQNMSEVLAMYIETLVEDGETPPLGPGVRTEPPLDAQTVTNGDVGQPLSPTQAPLIESWENVLQEA